MVNFIPEPIKGESLDVPFFENVKGADVSGRHTEKKVEVLQKEIEDILVRLGAVGITFQAGEYPGKTKRFGFRIGFVVGANRGRIDCAALPLRTFTPHKKDRALAAALFLVRDELKAALMAKMYKPGSVPLLPYMLDNKGRTLTEALTESPNVPLLVSLNGR